MRPELRRAHRPLGGSRASRGGNPGRLRTLDAGQRATEPRRQRTQPERRPGPSADGDRRPGRPSGVHLRLSTHKPFRRRRRGPPWDPRAPVPAEPSDAPPPPLPRPRRDGRRAPGPPRPGPASRGVRHRDGRNGGLLQRGRHGPALRRPGRDAGLAPPGDLRPTGVRPDQFPHGRRARGRAPDDVHDRLVHQRRLHLPRVRPGRHPAHRAVAPLRAPRAPRSEARGASGVPGPRARPDDGMSLPPTPHELRLRSDPRADVGGPGAAGGARRPRAHQPRDGARVRRLGPRLLHEALRGEDRPQPDERRVLRHRAVQQRALPPLVLQGEARHRRRDDPRPPDLPGAGAAEGEPRQQRGRLQRQLQHDPRLPHHGPATDASRAPLAPRREGRRLRHPVHGGDAQLPLGRGALPRGGDRHRRAHP